MVTKGKAISEYEKVYLHVERVSMSRIHYLIGWVEDGSKEGESNSRLANTKEYI